jgi:hypothetical protein
VATLLWVDATVVHTALGGCDCGPHCSGWMRLWSILLWVDAVVATLLWVDATVAHTAMGECCRVPFYSEKLTAEYGS